jgi:hypothetical protein
MQSKNKQWKKRQKEIAALRVKLRGSKYKVEMPSLKIEQNVSPLGNKFAPINGKKSLPKDAKHYPVGHSHKQGTQLITEGMIKNNELQFLGGKKT